MARSVWEILKRDSDPPRDHVWVETERGLECEICWMPVADHLWEQQFKKQQEAKEQAKQLSAIKATDTRRRLVPLRRHFREAYQALDQLEALLKTG